MRQSEADQSQPNKERLVDGFFQSSFQVWPHVAMDGNLR